ncbi:hypothetical protein [Paenibacillus arenilitoris]|uniref:Uncharacterized protein n=1 Tax=Paenibacillus arenilitoris TaxID=2772299 RepID=A0A927H7I6_9BACL|nr:hypothetical protein [Paenibacillus arenilitoris]MBD2870572.1 hypothetical protein [Paenibacillus arenilitoris]
MLQASWYAKALGLVGRPVGVSLVNGQGVTGVLCSVTGGTVVLQEYLYQSQFAAKQYPYDSIQDINAFPGCSTSGPLY